MAVHTRRVLPQHAREVRDQLKDLDRRIDNGSLSRGARGDAVADLQKRLRSFGVFEGKANGVFDAKTENAVRSFQQKANIIADGVAGPQTLGAIKQHTLFVEDNFETVGKRGQSGADVKSAERMLKDIGMAPGKVDGVFDKATGAAIARFRAGDPSLPDGARMDARTFARLRERSAKPLQQGDHKPGVRVLESNLKALGLNPGAVDRDFRPRTREAVATFQRNNDLDVTGIADKTTRARIQQKVDALKPPEDTLATFERTPPKSDYRRIQRDGETVNRRTNEMLNRAEAIMAKKFGHAGFEFRVVQGSYSGSVAASGGTHDGGGALDIHTASHPRRTVDHMVKALRMAGFAGWSRGRGHDSFDPHIHAIAIGDRQAAPLAKQQVQNYFAGRNGLASNRIDPNRNVGRPFPQWAAKFD